MENTTEDNKIWKFRASTFLFILASAISFTFTVTTVYNKFLFQEEQMNFIEKEFTEMRSSVYRVMNEKDTKTNGRLDKVTSRIISRVEELEKPKSD